MDFFDNLINVISDNLKEQTDRRHEAYKNIKAYGDALPRDVKLNLDREYYTKK